MILDEAFSSDSSSLCIARRRLRFQRRTPTVTRMSKGIAAPMPAPIPTPLQPLGESEGSGEAVVVAAVTIEGRLAADTSTEDDEVDSELEVAKVDEVVNLSAADGSKEVDDDSLVGREAAVVLEEDAIELVEEDDDGNGELEEDFAETIKSGAENIRF